MSFRSHTKSPLTLLMVGLMITMLMVLGLLTVVHSRSRSAQASTSGIIPFFGHDVQISSLSNDSLKEIDIEFKDKIEVPIIANPKTNFTWLKFNSAADKFVYQVYSLNQNNDISTQQSVIFDLKSNDLTGLETTSRADFNINDDLIIFRKNYTGNNPTEDNSIVIQKYSDKSILREFQNPVANNSKKQLRVVGSPSFSPYKDKVFIQYRTEDTLKKHFLAVWNYETSQMEKLIPTTEFDSIDISPDQKYAILTKSESFDIHFYNLESGQKDFSLNNLNYVNAIDFSKNNLLLYTNGNELEENISGKYLPVGSPKNQLKLWNVENEKIINRLNISNMKEILNLKSFRNSRILAIQDEFGSIQIWDMDIDVPISSIKTNVSEAMTNKSLALDISKDEKLMITNSLDSIYIFKIVNHLEDK